MDELDLASGSDEEQAPRRPTGAAQPRQQPKRRAAAAGPFVALLHHPAGLRRSGHRGVHRHRPRQGHVHRRRLQRRRHRRGDGRGPLRPAAADIANTLVEKDVVKSAKAFVEAAEERRAQQEAASRASTTLRKQMRAADALSLMLDPQEPPGQQGHPPRGPDLPGHVQEALRGHEDPGTRSSRAAAKDPKALGVADYWFTRQDRKQVAKASRASCSRRPTTSRRTSTPTGHAEDHRRAVQPGDRGDRLRRQGADARCRSRPTRR